jgi:pectate lyase
MKKQILLSMAGVILSLLCIFIFACEDPGSSDGPTPAILVEEITINGGNITLKTGTNAFLTASVSPANASKKDVIWSSSTGAVTVDRTTGEITAKARGSARITASALDNSGSSEWILVTVTDEDPALVDEITITGGDVTLTLGQNIRLSAMVLPENAGNRNVIWASDAPGIVQIDQNGNIKAIAEGEAIITAMAQDGSGVYGEITVTVGSTGGNDSKPGEVITPPGEGSNVSGDVTIIESKGWLETLYVKWQKLSGAESFNVYYRGGSVSAWTKIDSALIREYQSYIRADILGLAAGTYDVEVRPVKASGEYGSPAKATGITVVAHDRAGFAFKNGAVPGAYKADGTLKAGARTLYVTNDNKNTVTLTVKTSASKEETFTGLNAIILAGHQKGYENRPLVVRFIGKVTEQGFTLEGGDIMIKDNGKNNGKTSYITLEGVGDDAVVYGWGIRTSRASNVEIRNLGFMQTNSVEKDDIGLQESSYMWIHNNDLFYGKAGGDEDQAKGDGALDAKKCDYVTISYNHFWDTGKSHLLGNGTESPGYHTYHHNWYDHSDSRHPRVRFHHTHVYNNYYDGVSKYGIGATQGSSIFAEGNYFRRTKNPMLISMQGTDTKNGTDEANGTFSKEDGGIIKAYNNYMDDYSKNYLKPYSSTNTVHFDAYLVNSQSEKVPANVTTKKGAHAYNNFDTIYFDGYPYTLDEPDVAKQNVQNWSGRYWLGDFKWTFNDAVDDTSYSVNTALMNALVNYQSGLVKVLSDDFSSGGGSTGGGGDTGGGETGGGGGLVEGDVFCTFTSVKNSGSNPAFSITGNTTNGYGTVTVNGTTYTYGLKMESSTNISFTIANPMTLTLVFGGTTAAGNKKVLIDGTTHTTGADGKLTVSLTDGTHVIKKGDSMNLFYIALVKT